MFSQQATDAGYGHSDWNPRQGVLKMPYEKTLVCGTYLTEADLQQAIDHLHDAGFLGTNLSVLLPEAKEDGDIEESASAKPERSRSSFRAESGGILDLIACVLHKGRIFLSVCCEGSEQALVATKILEHSKAQNIVSSGPSIADPVVRYNPTPVYLA